MRYFETKFLDDAKKFLKTLQPKTAKKVFYNIDLAEQTNDQKFLRNSKMTFGSFGQNTQDFKYDFLHFGTRPTIKKLW